MYKSPLERIANLIAIRLGFSEHANIQANPFDATTTLHFPRAKMDVIFESSFLYPSPLQVQAIVSMSVTQLGVHVMSIFE